MTAWAANDRAAMLALCAPSWCAAQPDAEQSLFFYCANRIACAWAFDGIVTDVPITMDLRVSLAALPLQEPGWKACRVIVIEEDGLLWILPDFMAASVSASPCEAPAEDAIITPDQ